MVHLYFQDWHSIRSTGYYKQYHMWLRFSLSQPISWPTCFFCSANVSGRQTFMTASTVRSGRSWVPAITQYTTLLTGTTTATTPYGWIGCLGHYATLKKKTPRRFPEWCACVGWFLWLCESGHVGGLDLRSATLFILLLLWSAVNKMMLMDFWPISFQGLIHVLGVELEGQWKKRQHDALKSGETIWPTAAISFQLISSDQL